MASKRPPNGLIQIQGTQGGLSVLQPAISVKDSLLAKNTVRAYCRDWMDFFGVDDLALITLPMCQNTTPEQVSAFRDRLIEKGLGPGTIGRKLTALRTLFDYLITREVMTINPAHRKLVRGPKRGQVKKMEWLAPDEARRFLNAIDRTTEMGRRDYALIMADLHMGARRSEVLSMRTDEFKDAGGQAYYIFRSKGEKERKITINRDLMEAFEAYSKDRGTAPGWLFPGRKPETHLSGDQFWRIVNGYLEKAEINKKVGTHGLRATFITVNLEKGTPLSEIQKTVGHSRGETTLGYARDLEAIKSRAPAAMEGLKADPQGDQP